MARWAWIFQQTVFLLVVLLAVTGCGLFDHGDRGGPTDPLGAASPELAQSISVDDATAQANYAVRQGGGSFVVDVPSPGLYLLRYVIQNLGMFEIVFRAEKSTSMIVWLGPTDTVLMVSLHSGYLVKQIEGTPYADAITWYAWPGSSYPAQEIFIPKKAVVPEEAIIVAIGDSLTYKYGNEYPPKLEAMLRSDGYTVTVKNEGVPGEQSPSTEKRFERDTEDANIVLLMIGTNDIIVPGNCPHSECDTIEHIESMLSDALSLGKIPLVSTIPPPNPNDDHAWMDSDVQALNRDITSLAARLNVILVDNYQAIRDHGYDALYSDALHFTDQGNQVIADHWYRAIMNNHLLSK